MTNSFQAESLSLRYFKSSELAKKGTASQHCLQASNELVPSLTKKTQMLATLLSPFNLLFKVETITNVTHHFIYFLCAIIAMALAVLRICNLMTTAKIHLPPNHFRSMATDKRELALQRPCSFSHKKWSFHLETWSFLWNVMSMLSTIIKVGSNFGFKQ